MSRLTATSWPSARQFAEAVQCPAICFGDPTLKGMLPAVDRLGMPLVTSGQFAYVFKLNARQGGDSLAVRCFRGFLGDREDHYAALDAHLAAARLPALPRFRYLPHGILVAGHRYPALVMEWIAGPTLDVYLDEVVGRGEVLLHLAEEWLRLMGELREARVAHGDLQHGNIIVERGRLRLVDLDGMFAPALEGRVSSEVGHQHYQHPARAAHFFSLAVDNFSALVIYLSLIALAERPSLWVEHHDENLIFRRADFLEPESSALFRQVRELGGECATLAELLAVAAKSDPAETPWLLDLTGEQSKLPLWMTAPDGLEVGERTREAARTEPDAGEVRPDWTRVRERRLPADLSSGTVQTLFGAAPAAAPVAPPPLDPTDIAGNTFQYAKQMVGRSYGYLWWLPVHNFIIGPTWSGIFGIEDGAGMFLSLVFFVVGFLLCGFARALYVMETVTGAAQTWQTLNIAPPAPPAQLPAPAQTGAPADRHTPLFGVGRATTPPPAGVAQAASAATTPPRVVGNRKLNIYHLPACVWVDTIAARSRAEFDSPASALQAGYRPCRVCLP